MPPCQGWSKSMTLLTTPVLEQIAALEAERSALLAIDYLTRPERVRLRQITETLLPPLWEARRQELAPRPEPQKPLPRLEELDDTQHRQPRLRGGKPRKYNRPRVLAVDARLECPDCRSTVIWKRNRSARAFHFQCQSCGVYFTQALPSEQWEPDTLPHCPRCGDVLRRNGFSDGIQRYKCNNCTYRGSLTAA